MTAGAEPFSSQLLKLSCQAFRPTEQPWKEVGLKEDKAQTWKIFLLLFETGT